MRAALVPLVLLVLPGPVWVLVLEALHRFGSGDSPRLLHRVRAPRRTARWATDRLAGVTAGLERIGVLTRRPEEHVPAVPRVLELRRLAAEVRRIEVEGQPHQAARLCAALAAYDHVLLELCTELEVPTPSGLLPLHPRARLDLEVGLVATGVQW